MRAVRRYAMLARGDRVLVAVSGGPDSMALLHALRLLAREEGWEVQAAHLHHALRGADADLDLALVRAYAEGTGVPLHVERLAPESLQGPGFETRARARRYAFLRRVAVEVGALRIATGHTLDDQAETVLLRLLRGSGPRGVRGIQPRRRDGVIRPLILARRRDVIDYLGRAGVAHREDPTNRDPRYLRNRVRHELLPLLEGLAPRTTEHLARLADRLRADESYLDGEARRLGKPWLEAAARGETGAAGGGPDLAGFAKLPEAVRVRVLLLLLKGAGVPADRVSDAVARVEEHLAPGAPPGGIDLGGGLRLRWDAGGLRVSGVAAAWDAGEAVRLAAPGTARLGDGRHIEATVHPGGAPAEPARDEPDLALFDLDDLLGPEGEGSLSVRARRPGDRMRPRGFGHWRKLKDVLIDARVPRDERGRVPIVLAGDEIVWAAGVRASERGRPTSETRRWLRLALLDPARAS
jgi:tRNA(Ile)-lysidine synthase